MKRNSSAFSPLYSQPKIVEKAKRIILIVTNTAPALPSAVSNAAIVSSAPSSILPSAFVVPSIPLDAIARPVIVQTIIVSINVPHIFIKPCFTWWSDVALAAEIAALPSPASFENTPLAIP